MKSRRELKALLLASVAALTLMSGCSKNNDEEAKEPEKAYYMIVGDEYVEIENVKSAYYASRWDSSHVFIEFNDGTTMTLPIANFYEMDKSSELQQELIRKLTK